MSVDLEIRRLAADPEMKFAIRIIDCFFESMAVRKDSGPVLAGVTREQIIEDCWCLFKRGIFRLYDPEVDDDDLAIKVSQTPGERTRARVMGAKLFAVRQCLRRAATRRRTEGRHFRFTLPRPTSSA